MNTSEKLTDSDALLKRIIGGKLLDAETYERVRKKGERITEELRRTYGEMDLAVGLVREVRDEA